MFDNFMKCGVQTENDSLGFVVLLAACAALFTALGFGIYNSSERFVEGLRQYDAAFTACTESPNGLTVITKERRGSSTTYCTLMTDNATIVYKRQNLEEW